MNGKKNYYKKQANDIRSSLDDILNDSDDIDASIDNTDLPPIRRVPPAFDYTKKKTDSTFQAKKTINTLLKFYLSEEIIDNDEYIKAKMKIEEMTLGSLIFQMETAERAITTLLQQIDDGDVSPRMFEVLGTLQKSMLDIIKSQTMYMMATEEGVKKLARDYDVYSERKKLGGGEEVKKLEHAASKSNPNALAAPISVATNTAVAAACISGVAVATITSSISFGSRFFFSINS